MSASPTVVFVPTGGAANPDPAHCAGSVTAPTAAAGFVCIYEADRLNLDPPAFFGSDATATGPMTHGLGIQFTSHTAGGVVDAGTWAVTAP